MIALGRVWKTVTGREPAREPAAGSTVVRDVTAARPLTSEPAWEPVEAEPSETRSAERFVPRKAATVLTTTGGKRIAARIINISRTGVALEAELSEVRPEDITTVGTRPVLPGRRIALGMVFLFRKPLDPKLCGPDIIL